MRASGRDEVWDGASLRLEGVASGALAVCDASGRLLGASPPARALLARLGELGDGPLALPAGLWRSIARAEPGESSEWAPAEGDLCLGCTAYPLEGGRLLLLMRDVSEKQRQLASRLQRQRLESMGQIVASIAHDIRSFLAPVVFNAEVLLDGAQRAGREEDEGAIAEMLVATTGLRRLVDEILDFARVGPPVVERVSLTDVLARASGLLRSVLREGGHSLVVDLAPDALLVRGNPISIERGLVNVLVNATEAGRALRIGVSSRRTTSSGRPMVRVQISDDGPGIPESALGSLFRPFFTTKPAGTGLGLSAARDALRDLGMPENDGIDLLGAVRATSPRTRAVLMSAFATARDYKTAVDLGAVTVLCKPFTPADLVAAIRQAAECETGFHGTFHAMSLVDILQMFHFGRRSVTVHVLGAEAGLVHVEGGEIVHAAHGALDGAEAFAAILAARSGAIRTTALEEAHPRTISRSFESLLLDSLRELDEAGRSEPGRAESGDFALFASLVPPPAPRLSLAPAPAASTDPLALAREAWSVASPAIGASSDALVAVALSLEGDHAEVLSSGGGPDEAWIAAGRDVLAASARLGGGGDLACDVTGSGPSIGVVRHARAGYAVLLFETTGRPGSATWFRSYLGTVARCALTGGK